MSQITYEQFQKLVNAADTIYVDGNLVGKYNADEGEDVMFEWTDDEGLGYEESIDDTVKFDWLGEKGVVACLSPNGMHTHIRFVMEVPLTKIPE